MKNFLTTIAGKLVRKIAQIRGGGSALPGLFIERVNPKFIADMLDKLPYGVVIISGTNGKTTTTKMVAELLEAQGLKVFTNKTGSNFVRGVAASILSGVSWSGKFNFDIAVLELDEAHAVKFLKIKKPRYSLLLNVMRDQLDRFGEIDYTASLLQKIGEATEDIVVLNRDDFHLGVAEFHGDFRASKRTFGVAPELRKEFPNDSELHGGEDIELNNEREILFEDDVSLEKVAGRSAIISFDGEDFDLDFEISGIYNLLNAAAAIALVRAIFNREKLELSRANLLETAQSIKPAFGRGETVEIDGVPIELVLVKNPGGFRLGLKSFAPENYSTMIAINDNYADGRDMSWLWDVDFSSLADHGVEQISGIRAYDMALRLFHDDVGFVEDDVETDLKIAVENFVNKSQKPKRIFCTYTAMLKIREELAKITDVEKVL